MVDEKLQSDSLPKKEKGQTKELTEFYEYLEQEVYPALQISAADEEQMVAEAKPERRDLLRRSFDNIRKTIKAFFEIETVDGRFNYVSYRKERDLMVSKQVYSIIAPELEKLGFSKDQLIEAKITEETTKISFRTELDSLLYSQDVVFSGQVDHLAELAILNQAQQAFSKQGQWRHFSAKPIYLEIIEMIRKRESLSPQIKEAEDDFLKELWQASDEESIKIRQHHREQERSLSSELVRIENIIQDLWRSGKIIEPQPSDPRFNVKKSRDEVLAEIIKEQERVKQTQFIAINLPAKRILKLISTRKLLGIFSLPEEQKIKRAGELGEGSSFYLRQRQAAESSLGIHSAEQSVVYGCYCSANNYDEVNGGEPTYGYFFVVLKPEVANRTVFTEGDSLTNHGLTQSVAKKISDQNISVTDYDKFAPARQVVLEHAPLAKALFNIEAVRDEELTGARQSFSYIEAHIVGGVRVDDIQTINIPQSIVDFRVADADQGNYEEALRLLSDDPAWKEKIRITGS